MVTDIVNINCARLTVLYAGKDAPNVGFADGAGAERSRVRQQRFEELDRYNTRYLRVMGVVESIPTFSRHFMWVR